MNRRKWQILSLISLLALVLTWLRVPLASSQGTTLMAAQVDEELPLQDPDSALWQRATAVEVPLSAQITSKPMLRETRVKAISARALHDGSSVVFLIEWADKTENNQMVRVQDFRDAVALQFPLVDGQPFFCMGMQGGNVDIWHWKADWQADLIAWQDMEAAYADMDVDQYPFAEGDQPAPSDYQDVNYVPALAAGNLFASPRLSPVEDIVAGGFGTLTAEPAASQNVQGYGVWEDGKWRVIFSRELVAGEPEDASFELGKVYSVAFAAWDGDNGERNGQKSTSQWISFQLEGQAAAPAEAEATETEGPLIRRQVIALILVTILALLFVVGGIIYYRLPE